jgi:CRP-like cAMP-binding protein
VRSCPFQDEIVGKQSTFLSRNLLLAAMVRSDADLLKPDLEPIELEMRFSMERSQIPIHHVYFPDSGIASTVAVADQDRRLETGLFGREGMSGLAVVLGSDRSPHETFVQIAGLGQRIASEALRRAMRKSPTLSRLLLSYMLASTVQSAQTTVANGKAGLEVRLARWLLMCHDRVEGDQLFLTHDLMAVMLGVRRAGVTGALHALKGDLLVSATRGSIIIEDRRGLEDKAGGYYGSPEAEYSRLIWPAASAAFKEQHPCSTWNAMMQAG